jgi:aldehyde:ferredoxin oxidoreductase
MALMTGDAWTAASLRLAGRRIVDQERVFNRANGFTAADDSLPTRFTAEPVPDGVHAGRVCALEPLLDEYYALRGWSDEGRALAMAPVRSRPG